MKKTFFLSVAVLWAVLANAQPKLLLHYDFKNIEGDKVIDLSESHFDGTLKGSATAG